MKTMCYDTFPSVSKNPFPRKFAVKNFITDFQDALGNWKGFGNGPGKDNKNKTLSFPSRKLSISK